MKGVNVATNEKRCILAAYCRNAGDVHKCNHLCPAFIGLHGATGESGRVMATMLPADYRYVTLKNSPVRDELPDIYAFLEKYVETFDRMFTDAAEADPKARIKSLYLWSATTGTGKTTTAAALVNEWVARHFIGSVRRKQTPDEVPAFFLDVNEWQTLYNKMTRQGVSEDVKEEASAEYYRRMDYAMQAPFAVLDDIGVRSASDSFRGDLHTVINHRVVNRMPTVYTSNYPIADMAEVFDARLFDRIRDHCKDVEFNGRSHRGLRR